MDKKAEENQAMFNDNMAVSKEVQPVEETDADA